MREERFTSTKEGNKREYFINGIKMTMLEKKNVFFFLRSLAVAYMKYRLHGRNTIVAKNSSFIQRAGGFIPSILIDLSAQPHENLS